MFRRACVWAILFFVMAVLSGVAQAQALFDLVGPRIDMRVQRDGKTLPIASVPTLQAGDRIWLHADLPETQSARYLMIVAFLRGATNPPPESWFTQVETWTKAAREEGVFVTVPPEAQQALVFLAPETGGGFSALRGAVRGKPGAFVRAVQNLEVVSLDRMRIEKYLDAVRESTSTPEELHKRSVLLARSLSLKLDEACFDKPTAEQITCLTQHTDQMVLDDANTQSMVTTLTSGDTGHLLSEITSTPKIGGGAYSPYVGAIVDVARILGNAHTAHYQYIPALALPKGDQLNLRLNSPPSFRNPKSVLVIGLPHVGPAVLPRMRPVDPAQVFCLQKPGLVLQVDNAPLVFATELAHNMVLHVDGNSTGDFDLPLKADPASGGFVVDTKSLPSKNLDAELTGTIRGVWGSQPFEGPKFKLHSSRPPDWVVASRDASALIVGRADTVRLRSGDACCVKDVSIADQDGNRIDTKWKAVKADELELQVSLKDAKPGPLTLTITNFGQSEENEIPLQTYAEAGRLDAFEIHAGDSEGVLTGTRLDEVSSLEVSNVRFSPGALARAHQQDELTMKADGTTANSFRAGDSSEAKVTLKDERVLPVRVTVNQPRPSVELMSKRVDLPARKTEAGEIQLTSKNELPQSATLTFVLKARAPETFPPKHKVEVATEDESFRVLLSVADGNLMLQDSKTVVALLDPMRHLGPSAFGPLKFRVVSENETVGDWQSLANLVRLPTLKEVRCTAAEKQCSLVGEKLYLLDSVSLDPDFNEATSIPDGFIGRSLPIAVTKSGRLYLRLRDDGSSPASVTLPLKQAE